MKTIVKKVEAIKDKNVYIAQGDTLTLEHLYNAEVIPRPSKVKKE